MGLPLPSSVCKDAGAAAAMRSAIAGIASCLPDAPEVQTLANSVTACSSFYTIFLTWIATIWKALCYLISVDDDLNDEIVAIQEDLVTVHSDLVTIQNEIDAIPIMRTPGAVNIAVGASAGLGGAASIVGNDTAGVITITTGTGVANGDFFTLTFTTPYTTAGILHLEPGNKFTSAVTPLATTATTTSGSVGSGTTAYSDGTTFDFNYVVLGGT